MLFDFNLYSSLLLPFVLQGILFAALLLARGWHDDRLSDRLLGLLILVYALRISQWMLGFAGWYDSHDAFSTFMFYFPFNWWFTVGPLLYFYFRSLTNRDFRFRSAHLWHFAPALFFFVLDMLIPFVFDVIISHWMQGEAFSEHFGTKGAWDEWVFLTPLGLFYELTLPFFTLYYFFRTVRLFYQYRVYFQNQFSAEEGPLLFNWLRNFLVAALLVQALWILFQIAELINKGPLTYIQDWYAFFALGFVVYYLSIWGYNAPTGQLLRLQFRPEEPELPPSEEPQPAVIWKQKLDAYMRTHRPYLNPDMNLPDLARGMGISASVLSRALNTELGQNFNEFVNSYRVEAVKEAFRTQAQTNLSLLGIAYDSGFNSKATFNRAFRKHTGVSPSEYLKQLTP